MHEKMDAEDTANEQEISLLDVLNFLKKYIKTILGVALIAGLLAAVVAMRMPNVYTAKLKLIPPSQALLQPVLESKGFADVLVQRFNLIQAYGAENISRARDQLMEHTHIKSKDGTLAVEVDDVDPKRAAALANAYPEELDKFIVSKGLNEAVRQQEKIELRIQNLQEQLNIVNKKFDAIDKKLSVPVEMLVEEKEKRENIAILRAQLNLILEGDSSITSSMPSLDRLREQLDRLFQPVSMVAIKRMGSAEQSYFEYFSQVRYLEMSMELLKRRQALLKLDERMNKTRVLDSAEVPEKKSAPKRMVIVVSTMLAAGFLTFLLVLLKEWFVTIRKQTGQITSAL